jgi:hypothetical protein
MACIIKSPNSKFKGVITITNLEFSKIKLNLNLINEIKKNWVLLFHPNYYDYNFINKGIFDGYLASKTTFRVKDDSEDKVLNMSCHNFAPKYFGTSNDKKIYDFVGLSKLQTSKGNPKDVVKFLTIVKNAMDIKKNISGVLIISVPGTRPFKTNFIRSKYNRMFSEEQKKRFEFITLDYDVPFPLSLKTISLFYKNSKVHLNVHPKEKHGRAQAYALACSIPIVGFENLTYLVEEKYRKEPYYFIVNEIEQFSNKLVEAIDYVDNKYDELAHNELAQNFKSFNSFKILKEKLIKNFKLDDKGWNFTDDWDVRLAKHHLGHKTKNTYEQDINEFLTKILYTGSFTISSEEDDDNQFILQQNALNKLFRLLKYISYTKLKNLKSFLSGIKQLLIKYF